MLPAKWYDDAHSLVSHLLADAGQIADRRVHVVIAALRELLAREDTFLEWCDTSVQLADALTKLDAERGFLRLVWESGLATIRPSSDAIESKRAIRAARHRRADAARAEKAKRS